MEERTVWRRLSLGELEMAVMDVLWAADEPLSVRQIHETLCERREIAYTTAMTVLTRLTRKSLVTQWRNNRAFRYAPRRMRAELVAELLVDVLGEAPESAGRTAALLQFVGRVGSGEQAAMRAALAVSAAAPAT